MFIPHLKSVFYCSKRTFEAKVDNFIKKTIDILKKEFKFNKNCGF